MKTRPSLDELLSDEPEALAWDELMAALSAAGISVHERDDGWFGLVHGSDAMVLRAPAEQAADHLGDAQGPPVVSRRTWSWAVIEYRGYIARIEFDDSADTFHGRVVNSGPYPVATFESTRAASLRAEFHQAVDEYLSLCAEVGIEPRKPFSGKLNVRLGSKLHAAVAVAAAQSGESINSWIVRVLEKETSS